MKNQLTDHEIELTRFSGVRELRKAQRKQLAVVTIVLICVAAVALGMAYHLLNR